MIAAFQSKPPKLPIRKKADQTGLGIVELVRITKLLLGEAPRNDASFLSLRDLPQAGRSNPAVPTGLLRRCAPRNDGRPHGTASLRNARSDSNSIGIASLENARNDSSVGNPDLQVGEAAQDKSRGFSPDGARRGSQSNGIASSLRASQ